MTLSDGEILAMSVAEFRVFVSGVPDDEKTLYRRLRVRASAKRYARRKAEARRQDADESSRWMRLLFLAVANGHEHEALEHVAAAKLSRRELAAVLDGLPEPERELFRELRRTMQLRVGQAAYRETHRDDERRRALEHYRRKMKELRKDPEALAAHRAADVERKRRARAA